MRSVYSFSIWLLLITFVFVKLIYIALLCIYFSLQ